MTPLLFVLAASAGALGRFTVGLLACSWQALLIVNVTGAAILGYAISTDLSTEAVTVIGIGLCGSLTTYSSFALEVRSLGWRWGSAYAALTIGCVCAAASIGGTLV